MDEKMTSSSLSQQKPSTCKICGESFDSETELVTHEVTKHPNVGNTQPPGKVESKKDNRVA
ncbi:MAG: hypothetical protein JO266_07990 [Acidobacteria bacterium]|nr:hypothetical protein [Acidobacteriota bacterium]MBV9481177.1 hypothetical protein [Acidobacteriota bacterium]